MNNARCHMYVMSVPGSACVRRASFPSTQAGKKTCAPRRRPSFFATLNTHGRTKAWATSHAPWLRHGLTALLTLGVIMTSLMSATAVANIANDSVAGTAAARVAQAQDGQVEGTVRDQRGDPIAEAQVVLWNQATLALRTTRTQHNGQFRFEHLAAGRYVVTVTAPGFAQSDTAVDVPAHQVVSLNIEMKIASLADSVLVTATRTEALSKEMGLTTTVLASGDLERSHVTTVLEALRSVPSLVVTQTGRRGGLTSIFARGGESDYNRVLVDGVPVNDPGGAFDFSTLTPENIEQMEIVRGPQSALYGSDAISSTIQLITRRGTTRIPELLISAEGGSFDFTREAGRFSGAIGRFDYSSSFSYQRTDGIDFNDDYTNRVASGRFGLHLNDRADLKFTVRSENSSLGVIGPTAVLFSDPDQRQQFRGVAVSGALESVMTHFWHQRLAFVYAENDRFSFDPVAQDLTDPLRPPILPGTFGVDFAFQFRSHQRRHGLHYQSDFALPARNLLSVGFDFERETGNLSGVRPERDNFGYYIQDQWAVRDRLFVRAGVRIEDNRADIPADLLATLRSLGSALPQGHAGFGVSANPRVSVAYFLAAPRETRLGGTRLRFNFGTGIKEPTLVEAFSPNPFFIGNPILNPERSRSFEVAADQYFFGQRAQVTAAYFDNRFRDLITFKFDPATFGPVRLPNGQLTHFKNTDRASARGVELIASARPLRQLGVAGSYTFLRTRIDEAEPVFDFASGQFIPDPEVGLSLLRRPRHAGTLNVTWQSVRYMVNLDATFIGRRRDIDPLTNSRFDAMKRPVFNDGYSKLNLSGSYRIAGRLTLFARIENLLNQRYDEALGFPAYRINFSAGLRFIIGGDR